MTTIEKTAKTTERTADESSKHEKTTTRSTEPARARARQQLATPTKKAPVAPEGSSQEGARRFGPRRTDVTHWRCRRVDASGKGALLFWGDDDIEESEWPIDSLSLEAIRDRWGSGRYLAEYYGTNESGARVQRGKSAVIHLREPEVIDHEALAPAPRAAQTAAVAPVPALPSGNTDFQTVFSLLAFLEDRNEKARLSAATEAKMAIDRSTTEAKLAQERYRADLEFQLERERLASQERIAQIEAMHRGAARQQQPPPAPPIDQTALVQQLGTIVSQKVEEALEDFDPGDYGAGAGDSTTQIVTALRETLTPILSIVATNFLPKPPGPSLPSGPDGTNGGGGPAQ